MNIRIVTTHCIQTLIILMLAFGIHEVSMLDFVWSFVLSLACTWMISCAAAMSDSKNAAQLITLMETIILGGILISVMALSVNDNSGMILETDRNRMYFYLFSLLTGVLCAPVLSSAIWKIFHVDTTDGLSFN